MSATANTFAGQLRHFARSVDIVDDEIFDRVRLLIYKYVKTELGTEYFELMREQAMESQTGLKMFWSNEERDHYWPSRRADGSYTNIVTLSFEREQPVWIVGRDKKPLREAEALEDEWSHNVDLPRYEPTVDKPIRTLVVLPLKRKRILGVCYFECASHIGITDIAKAELLLLADAISILLELYEANRSQSLMTSSAIFELQERLESAKFPKLTRPHFFVAFSTRADKDVIRVISEVLLEFSDRLESTDWTHINESGNVNTQIAQEISRSRFGICYLSEPADAEGSLTYLDNPNVVFEAGMLHARTAANDLGDPGEPAGWIPVREMDSPPAPFDFAAERTLHIPRLEDHSLDEPQLHDMLANRVKNLLGEDGAAPT